MIERRLSSDDDSIIYHYCDTQTLNAILENKCLRFSDLSTMNDSSEWTYGFQAMDRVADKLADEADSEEARSFYRELQETIRGFRTSIIPMISCFSRSPDKLSQWRSYADDGQGWAIGFRVKELAKSQSLLFEVCYDTGRLEADLEADFIKLLQVWDDNGREFIDDIKNNAHRIAILLTAYKMNAFEEESEIRNYINIRVKTSEKKKMIIDKNGFFSEDRTALEQQIRFRTKGHLLVPYIDLPLPDDSLKSIAEIWRGPSNLTSDTITQLFLHSHDLDDCKIRSSSASYRKM